MRRTVMRALPCGAITGTLSWFISNVAEHRRQHQFRGPLNCVLNFSTWIALYRSVKAARVNWPLTTWPRFTMRVLGIPVRVRPFATNRLEEA